MLQRRRGLGGLRASAGRVWDLVTDVTRTGEWSQENTGAVGLDGAPGPTVGGPVQGHEPAGEDEVGVDVRGHRPPSGPGVRVRHGWRSQAGDRLAHSASPPHQRLVDRASTCLGRRRFLEAPQHPWAADLLDRQTDYRQMAPLACVM
jgi:hypothetical protein